MKQTNKKKKRIKSFILTLACILLTWNLSSQIVSDYPNFCKGKSLKTNKEYIFRDKNDNNVIQKITYLGEISIDGHKHKVLTSTINLSGKGVNDIIFVNDRYVTYIYRVNLNTDLPKYIASNKIYFLDESENFKPIVIKKLGAILCTPIECFGRNN